MLVYVVLSLVEYAYTCCCVVVKYPLVNCYIAIENGTFIVDLPIYLLKIVISHIVMLVYQMVYSQNYGHSTDPKRKIILVSPAKVNCMAAKCHLNNCLNPTV